MSENSLNIELRETSGSSDARKSRREGVSPITINYSDATSISCSVKENDKV